MSTPDGCALFASQIRRHSSFNEHLNVDLSTIETPKPLLQHDERTTEPNVFASAFKAAILQSSTETLSTRPRQQRLPVSCDTTFTSLRGAQFRVSEESSNGDTDSRGMTSQDEDHITMGATEVSSHGDCVMVITTTDEWVRKVDTTTHASPVSKCPRPASASTLLQIKQKLMKPDHHTLMRRPHMSINPAAFLHPPRRSHDEDVEISAPELQENRDEEEEGLVLTDGKSGDTERSARRRHTNKVAQSRARIKKKNAMETMSAELAEQRAEVAKLKAENQRLLSCHKLATALVAQHVSVCPAFVDTLIKSNIIKRVDVKDLASDEHIVSVPPRDSTQSLNGEITAQYQESPFSINADPSVAGQLVEVVLPSSELLYSGTHVYSMVSTMSVMSEREHTSCTQGGQLQEAKLLLSIADSAT